MGGVASAQGEIRKVHILKPEGKTTRGNWVWKDNIKINVRQQIVIE